MDPAMIASAMQMLNSRAYGAGAGDGSAYGDFLGPGVGSFMQGRKARKDKKRSQRRFKRALNATESIQGRGLQQQEALSRQATAQQLKGYDVARQEAARMGRESKQGALDRETQLGARASQNLASRGLGSTTMGANLQRGIASDTNRTISGVNEGLAGLYGNLAQGRAGVEAQGTQNLAGILGQQTDLQSQLAQMRMLGGATLGSTGTFDPGAWSQPGAGWQTGYQEGMGGMLGGMDPKMLAYLFGGHTGQSGAGQRYDMQPGFTGPPSPFG